MYLHNLLLFGFILFTQSLWGQEEPMFTYPKLIVKTDLISWAAPERPAFFAGLEYRPIPAVAIEVDYGIKLQIYPWDNQPEIFVGKYNYEYSKLRFGININPGYRYQFIQLIAGVQFYYHPESFTRFDNWYWRDGQARAYDRADIVMKSLGWNVHGCLQIRFTNQLLMQMYCGLGLKKISATHETINERARALDLWDLGWSFERDQINTNPYRLHIFLSMKLGYVIIGSHKPSSHKGALPPG